MFRLEELGSRIFHLSFESRYDLAMHFLRFQEFYECPNPKFRGKPFTIIDFMEWYSKENNNKFTYPDDWSGFNLPSTVMEQVFFNMIPDENKYDKFMKSVFNLIKTRGYDKFYIIGTQLDDKETVKHEIAHGMWFLNMDYRKFQQDNISKMNETARTKMAQVLVDMGYTNEVIEDEIQAYMSTGLTSDFKGIRGLVRKPFVDTLKKFNSMGA